MKKMLLLWALLLCLLPLHARAQTMEEALQSAVEQLQMQDFQSAYQENFPAGEDVKTLILRFARGEAAADGESVVRALSQTALGALHGTVRRLLSLMAPAILCAVMMRMRAAFHHSALGEALTAACFLMIAAVMARDLKDQMLLAQRSVRRMADWMQALFPLLLTLLAAVGGKASSAFFQPAVAAACGTMTSLVRTVTLPLSLGAGVTVLLNHLSEKMRVSHLAAFFRSAAAWTLGIAFTVFLSVITLQSLGVAAADGIALRTAKYAVDNLVPVVGGMFADTVDTLVGASLLIKNALGVTGLLGLLSLAVVPMVQTLAAVVLYRAGAAFLEPLGCGRLCDCMQDFSHVLMLLFIIQLSVAAMFLLLVAQMLVVGNLTVMLR